MCLCRRQASTSSLLFSSLFSSLLSYPSLPLRSSEYLRPPLRSPSKPLPTSPSSPFPPLKTPVRVFQFPIHSARNPSRRLRHSISLASTHTRARSTKSFPVSARRMGIQSHTLIAQLNLSVRFIRVKKVHIDRSRFLHLLAFSVRNIYNIIREKRSLCLFFFYKNGTALELRASKARA